MVEQEQADQPPAKYRVNLEHYADSILRTVKASTLRSFV